MNDLFAKALKGSAAATATTTGTSPSAPSQKGISKDDVARTFDQVTSIVPHALDVPFAALHKAAVKISDTAKQDVPDILAAAPVAGAMKTITDYITDCQPPTTD